ncbi:MAG: RICIN domain-containing protein, partial [Actinobacteria bacterium]|nr:RICIN domain-containing protein [Actinomycetota bacterium]
PTAWNVPGTARSAAGNQVCLDGVTTNTSVCGTVAFTGRTITTPEGPLLIDQTLVSGILSQPGDSGAPMSWGGTVFGVVSRNATLSNVQYLDYSEIQNALAPNAFNATAITTGDRNTPIAWSLIQSRFNGLCFDVQWNGSTNGTNVQGYGCNGNPAQRWSMIPQFNTDGSGNYVYAIKRARDPSFYPVPGGQNGDMCLDLDIGDPNLNYGHSNSARIQEWGCTGQTNQQWRLVRSATDANYFQIVSMHGQNTLGGDNCIDLDSNTGTKVQIWQCHGDTPSNQNWRIS